MLWDLFCRVIDNWGDIGVCWRLASQLRALGQEVRLWVDQPEALEWMAPGAQGVARWDGSTAWPAPGEVVVEAFGCDPPAAFVRAMAARTAPPVWINLEYLSAEPYARRCHGLPSPQAGNGLTKFFFYPGFEEGTGGLLREDGLAARQSRFDARDWLAGQGVTPRPGERRVSLFCYQQAALPALLATLQQSPTLLLTTAGLAGEQVRALLHGATQQGALRVAYLPMLSQNEFDHLLWACDLNFVRGEDSFVRAQWAGRPFIWQAYPQDDAAHSAKFEAFCALLETERPPLPETAQRLGRLWNGLAAPHSTRLPWPTEAEWSAWQAHTLAWRARLDGQGDLSHQLLTFAKDRCPRPRR